MGRLGRRGFMKASAAGVGAAIGAQAAGPAGGPATLRAPMPGKVVKVLCQPGDAVKAGQGLLVIEAMKMENELKAAGPGVVEQVHATPGQAVEKGAVLVTFRAPGASDLT